MQDNQSEFPRLRTDLKWTLHRFADGPSYTVVNPATGLNYQVGLAEYAFASMLDGKTSIADAAAATRALAVSSDNPELAIDDSEGAVIANWLTKMKLTADHHQQTSSANHGRIGPAQISPLCIKMPLGRPRRIIDKLSNRVRLLTTPTALICSLTLIAAAMIQVLGDLDRWSVALQPLIDPNSWWILAAVALGLRVLHELAHAVVANRLDVDVDEVGILWILLMPLPYVDVSQSWQRSRRRDRILIAAAGMLAELVVAAIAVFVFSFSSSELARHLAATVALTASIITLLFNANVLMRFDGYHMLVDAVGIPNLYADATSYWRQIAVRIILGKHVHRRSIPAGWSGIFFRAYGLGAMGWRIVVFVGLVLAAEHLLGGGGVLLALAAVLALLIMLVRGLPRMLAGTRPMRVMFGVMIAAAAIFAFWYLPLLPGRTELGMVRHHEPSQIRARSEGFVRELFVRGGQVVRQGDPLVKLENVTLEMEVATLKIELAAAELRYRGFLAEDQMASVESQAASVRQLREKLFQRAGQLDRLTIRADAAGIITAPTESPDWDLSLWLGRFIREGTELMRVVRADEMEVVFLVDQRSRDLWSQHVGRQVKVRRPIDWHDEAATLISVAPQATDQLPGDALGAHQGGSLAIRPLASQAEAVRLLRPRFEARLRPGPKFAAQDGQRVLVTLPAGEQTMGEILGRSVADWLQPRVARHSLLRQFSSF